MLPADDDEGAKATCDDAEVEQELENPGSNKSMTVDEEEVDQLESDTEGFPPVREGQQSGPTHQEAGGKDKYTRLLDAGKRGKSKKTAVAQDNAHGDAVRAPGRHHDGG